MSRIPSILSTEPIDLGTMNRQRSPVPGSIGNLRLDYNLLPDYTLVYPTWHFTLPRPGDGQGAGTMGMSDSAKTLLKAIENLRLKPYDDQNGKDITAWVPGATVGYGHLIPQNQWQTYRNGLAKEEEADVLFDEDLAPFVKDVQGSITAKITQNQFDALVILAFNIGPKFETSSVVKLINNPKAKTIFGSLKDAWFAWKKSEGKVNAGLIKRRQAEWNIYTQSVYKTW